jgi:hypothetical protein
MNLTKVTGTAGSSVSAAAVSTEQFVAELVKFAESKPSFPAIQAKMMELQSGPLAAMMQEQLASLGPVMAGASSPQQQLVVIEKACALLLAVRNEIAGGRDFKLALTLMGAQNDRTGALLASAIDSPLKLDMAWAMFELSAATARAVLGKN